MMLNKFTGRDAAQVLASVWAGNSEGHSVGYFKNNGGDITAFETHGKNVIIAERVENTAAADWLIDLIIEMDKK